MTETEFLQALADAFSGNRALVILMVLGVNFTLAVTRAAVGRTFSWDKLPGILSNIGLPLIGYGAFNLIGSQTDGFAKVTIDWGTVSLIVLKYALPALRDMDALAKAAHSPLSPSSIPGLKLLIAIRPNSLVTHATKFKGGYVLQVKGLRGDKALVTVREPDGDQHEEELELKDLTII